MISALARKERYVCAGVIEFSQVRVYFIGKLKFEYQITRLF